MLIKGKVGRNLNSTPLSKQIETFSKMLKSGTQSFVNKRNKNIKKYRNIRETVKWVLLWIKGKNYSCVIVASIIRCRGL
jgi:2-hydroxy-3-keto-5-methylthiopentenyl-1-phosphate phosphatase